MEKSLFYLSNDNINSLENLCEPNSYRVYDKNNLPTFIPESLRNKCDAAVVVISGVVDNVNLCMINYFRKDTKDNSYDQQPIGFLINDNKINVSGCIIQHGNWYERTIEINNNNASHISLSGIIPNNQRGSIEELNSYKSINESFVNIVDALKIHGILCV